MMYAAAAADFVMDRKIKNLTTPVLASLFHHIEIPDTKKKARVRVQSETYKSKSESSKSGLESYSTLCTGIFIQKKLF